MDKSVRLQLQDFFELFSDLSKRAKENWPLSPQNSPKEPEKNPDYIFTSILYKEKLQSKKLRDTFIPNLKKFLNKKEFFSSSVDFLNADEILNKIGSRQDLRKKILNPDTTKDTLPFLLVACHNSNKNKPLAVCILRYFPPSESILIEAILVAYDLPNSEEEYHEELKQSKSNIKAQAAKQKLRKGREKRQQVLDWILNYKGQPNTNLGVNKLKRINAALPGLVIEIELLKSNIPNESSLAVKGIFHEAINPVATFKTTYKQQRKAAWVLLAFNEVKAKFIHFAYYRPVVDDSCREFFLLTLPNAIKFSNLLVIESELVMNFIIEYGRYLDTEYDKIGLNGQNKYEIDKNFWTSPDVSKVTNSGEDERGSNCINKNGKSLYKNLLTKNYVYLHNVPRLEQPRFRFRRASVCFEILVDEDYFEPIGLDPYHYTTPLAPEHTTWEKIRDLWKVKAYTNPVALYCPIAHSGETDLFAYKYQSDPPYFTRYYSPLAKDRITINFPSHFEFTSEGRKETFYRLPEINNSESKLEIERTLRDENTTLPSFSYSVRMNACISYTFFLKSEVRVWHLVLKTIDDDENNPMNDITELEIVKLMRFFSGSQESESEEERRQTMRQIKFSTGEEKKRIDEENTDNLIQLLQDLTGVKYQKRANRKYERLISKEDQFVSLRNVRSGIIEIDTGDITPISKKLNKDQEKTIDEDSFLNFFQNPDAPTLSLDERNKIRQQVKDLYKNLYNGDIHMADEPEPFSAEEYADYVFKSYCGICLGIFDYDRMGFQEIDDTLVPLPNSKTEESFMVIHRGVLAMLGYEDDVMDTFWNTLGINAYLLIPSAVLANNDMVSRDAEGRLNKLLDPLRLGKSSLSIHELIDQRNIIDDLLNDDILNNVFQYKTEQELYQEGMDRRGIAERVKDSRSKLEQLDKLINTLQEERNARAQKFIQIFAAIFGLTSLYTPLRDLYVDEIGYNPKEQISDSISNSLKLDKQKVEIQWNSIKYDDSKTFVDWLFPKNALEAAHHQISLIIGIVLIYSLISWASSPGSVIFKFFQRRKRKQRKPAKVLK